MTPRGLTRMKIWLVIVGIFALGCVTGFAFDSAYRIHASGERGEHGPGNREKMFERLHDELPYQTTVETDSWKQLPDGSTRIEQTIYVSRDSHKKIVICEGGRTIKSIGAAARGAVDREVGRCRPPLGNRVRAQWYRPSLLYRCWPATPVAFSAMNELIATWTGSVLPASIAVVPPPASSVVARPPSRALRS